MEDSGGGTRKGRGRQNTTENYFWKGHGKRKAGIREKTTREMEMRG